MALFVLLINDHTLPFSILKQEVYLMEKRVLGFIIVLLSFFMQQSVWAVTIKVEGWCLDVAREIKIGGGDKGRQVIAWPECHGEKNQKWKIENGLIKSMWDDKEWCLDVAREIPVGTKKQGLEVIVWPNCHGGKNQKWEVKEGFIHNAEKGWCLDKGVDLKIGTGDKGLNVIIWPDCHGNANQKWSIE